MSNVLVFEKASSMRVEIAIAGIETAPRDETDVQLVDMMADSPEWGPGCYVADASGWFSGTAEDHREMLRSLAAGEIDYDDYQCQFWAQPTHWAPCLPLPIH